MTTTARKLKRRRFKKAHRKALSDVELWETPLQEHFNVTVARLMAPPPLGGQIKDSAKAELMAYQALVAGLAGMDLDSACRKIADGSDLAPIPYPVAAVQQVEQRIEDGDHGTLTCAIDRLKDGDE